MKTAKVAKAALGAIETDDMPALAAAYNVGVSRDYCPPPSRGTRRDIDEEVSRLAGDFGLVDDGDGFELPDVDEEGMFAFYDPYDRYQARYDAFLAGRGPHPDTI